MVVTGCGQKEAEPVETSTSTEAETISSETVASDAEAEASDALEHVNLSWYYIGSEQPDEEAVFLQQRMRSSRLKSMRQWIL